MMSLLHVVEADSHLTLLPASIYDIYKVLEHIDMLSIGIRYFAQILGFWVNYGVDMMSLRHG